MKRLVNGRALQCAVTVLCAVAVQQAVAAVEVTAALSQMRISATYLGTGAPEANGYRIGSLGVASTSTVFDGEQSVGQEPFGWYAPSFANLAVGSAATGPNGLVSHGALPSMSTSVSATASVGSISSLAGFWIAPHTRLAFSTNYSVSASVDSLDCAVAGCQIASAVAFLSISSNDLPIGVQEGASVSVDYRSSNQTSLSERGTWRFTVVNPTDKWDQLDAYATTTVDGSVYPQVPEPAEWVLICVGLVALGVAGRRSSFPAC